MPSPDLAHASWRKSSHSGGTGNACVEVAFLDRAVGVRDSKNATGPALAFGADQWAGFLAGVRVGTFDAN